MMVSGILAVVLTCHGQDSLLLRNYRFVKRSDAWLTSQNAAGLTRLTRPSIAEAELSLTKGKGGFVDWYQSPDDLQATAHVESFVRLSRRTVAFGAMTYDNFSGRDMAGTAFTDPDRKPFDIVEDSLGNMGTKHRDTYKLTGAVGVDVWRGMAVGLRLDYTASNYAKYKDLRHKTKLMDMTFTAGLGMPVAKWLSVGANYLYRRATESLTFSIYGRADKVYKSLIDYGVFMGRVEQFGSSGYTEKGQEMPLVDDYNGASLQLLLQPTGSLAFYQSLTYARRNGYYGRKSPYTITYTTHQADLLSYEARLSWTTRHAVVAADVALSSENLENLANTYRELQNESGAHYYEYYDPVKTANKLWRNGQVALTADWGIKGELPAWTLTAALTWNNRRQTSYLYPNYRRQHLHSTEASLSATRRLLTSRGVWTLSLTAAYQKGSGDPYTDLSFAETDTRQHAPDLSDRQNSPATMDAWLWREYQYLVAPQYGLGGSVEYGFIFPHTRLKTHVRLAATHRKANQTYEYSRGKDRTVLTLVAGCIF